MIVMACVCGARSDQDADEAQAEACWLCGSAMADTGIRWERRCVPLVQPAPLPDLLELARAA
jgi:hypothetical protein